MAAGSIKIPGGGGSFKPPSFSNADAAARKMLASGQKFDENTDPSRKRKKDIYNRDNSLPFGQFSNLGM